MATKGRAVLIDLSQVEALPQRETYWERGPDGEMQRVTIDVKTRGSKPSSVTVVPKGYRRSKLGPQDPHPGEQAPSISDVLRGDGNVIRKRFDDVKAHAREKARWGNGLEGLRREKSREIAALRADMKRDGRSRRETRKATAKLLRHYAKLEATMMRDK
jgi:hypothetical protein